jgi:hypothetical protein
VARVPRIPGAALGVALAALLAFSSAATAQVFYKWIDKDGKVQYGDRVPKGFTGPVTRIDVEPDTRTPSATPQVATPLPPAKADAPEDVKAPPKDYAKLRRDLRTKLADELARARERLESAKAALNAGGDPGDDERQVIQQRFNNVQPGRSNCRVVMDAKGKAAGAVCPALIPNDAYYERQKQLEDGVKKAEEEVAAAEDAYRRGVD